MVIRRSLVACLLAACATPAAALDDAVHVFAIWEGIRKAEAPEIAAEMDRLKVQFGPGTEKKRTGFAFIFPGAEKLRLACQLAREKKLELGVILPLQTHTRRGNFDTDLRSYQWRAGGDWDGFFNGTNNTNDLEIKEDARDHKVPTPSRYAAPVRKKFEAAATSQASELKPLVAEFPDVITVVNIVIEQELAIAAASLDGADGDANLGDYSPFAVTEFRDWLRHNEQYDASRSSAKYPGQGAEEGVTGRWVEIGGVLRSPFYDDPDPAHSSGTGLSFNEWFGTNFKTWTIRYWDPYWFKDAITNPEFNTMPREGPGLVEGGFDPPRQRDPSSRFWKAWSWDTGDQGGKYPPGHPAHPAWGFRQNLTAHWVQDMANLVIAAGIPKHLVTAHQIPGEAVGEKRCRSSASPVWTGWLPQNGSVGITRFGSIDPELPHQYVRLSPGSRGWGIFEWHPKPHAAPDDPQLHDLAARDLVNYTTHGCRFLFAGWWRKEDPVFRLDDSGFATAIREFLAAPPQGK